MKKGKNNKGFSLIELIIAIAILVILTGLLAPQFMRYMEKSREAKDMQTLDTVYGAVQVALADEISYKAFMDDSKTAGTLVELATTGMSLKALTDLNTNKFVKELAATFPGIAKAEWSSKAVTDAGGSDNVRILINPITLKVTVWVGNAVTAGTDVALANVLSPTEITVNTKKITTVGATFLISK